MQDLKLKIPDDNLFPFLRDGFVLVDDESGEGFGVGVRKFHPVFLVDIIQFQPAGENVFFIGNVFLYKLFHVILIPDLAENLFQQVFHGDDARGAAKFIHHPGDRLPVFREFINEIDGTHAFRNSRDGQEDGFDVFGFCKQGQLVHVALNVVDVFIIHYQLAQFCINEFSFEQIDGGIDAYGFHFFTRHEALPDLYIG